MDTNPKRYLIGRNRQAELLVIPKSDDPNHFDFYCANGGWHGNFKEGLVTLVIPKELLDCLNEDKKIEQKGYEILACDNTSDHYNEVFSRYAKEVIEILEVDLH